VAVEEPTINMTTGAPWQPEPETDAHWQGTLAQRPGPRAISRNNPICDAAHKHCLHTNTWFVSNMPEEPVSQVQVAPSVRPSRRAEGAPFERVETVARRTGQSA
jgi:hypothetical protein